MTQNPHRFYEFRCPVHGFVRLNQWERDIVDHPAFQRLRRIRQLAWTDYIYPGAVHCRFEHSLGVMHTASMLYDSVVRNSREVLESELAYTEGGLKRDRQLVRLTALLHDVGHGPFSHAGEELLPTTENGRKYEHEEYSAAIVRSELRDVIQNHPLNRNYGFRADDIAALLEGSQEAKLSLFWRDLITGQMDADRMDYLLRDSHHAGVQYGRYDLNRIIETVCAGPGEAGQSPRLGISESGWHAAESLVLARYFMFTQVYFHKTRVAYDIHLQEALREILPNGVFPRPSAEDLKEFLSWDDWRVLGRLQAGGGGEHGQRIANRQHYRQIYETPEMTSLEDLDELQRVKVELGDLVTNEYSATKSWYKTGNQDIAVFSGTQSTQVAPLSKYSNVVNNLLKNNQVKLFCRPEDASEARTKVDTVRRTQ